MLAGNPIEPTARSASSLRTVAVIPARYESSRFPGKPLAAIAGRPMIEHVYRRAAEARSVQRVIVATDDRRIVAAVESFGGEVRLTSPAHRSGTDRLAEVARTLDCDLVVNVQGDEPLLDPSAIDAAVAPFAEPQVLMATLCRRIADPRDRTDPNVVKVVRDARGDALYFSRASIPCARDPRGAAPVVFKHIGLYVYRRDHLIALAALAPTPLERTEMLEQLRALEHGYAIRAVETTTDSIGVDTPEDLERVRALVEGAPARAR